MKTSFVTMTVAVLALSACSADHSYLAMTADEAVGVSDPYAATAISSANWQAAETILDARLDEDPLKLLNLAYVYRKTGRDEAAIAIYDTILDGDANPYAERPNTVPLRVKTIARRAKASLAVASAKQPE